MESSHLFMLILFCVNCDVVTCYNFDDLYNSDYLRRFYQVSTSEDQPPSSTTESTSTSTEQMKRRHQASRGKLSLQQLNEVKDALKEIFQDRQGVDTNILEYLTKSIHRTKPSNKHSLGRFTKRIMVYNNVPTRNKAKKPFKIRIKPVRSTNQKHSYTKKIFSRSTKVNDLSKSKRQNSTTTIQHVSRSHHVSRSNLRRFGWLTKDKSKLKHLKTQRKTKIIFYHDHNNSKRKQEITLHKDENEIGILRHNQIKNSNDLEKSSDEESQGNKDKNKNNAHTKGIQVSRSRTYNIEHLNNEAVWVVTVIEGDYQGSSFNGDRVIVVDQYGNEIDDLNRATKKFILTKTEDERDIQRLKGSNQNKLEEAKAGNEIEYQIIYVTDEGDQTLGKNDQNQGLNSNQKHRTVNLVLDQEDLARDLNIRHNLRTDSTIDDPNSKRAYGAILPRADNPTSKSTYFVQIINWFDTVKRTDSTTVTKILTTKRTYSTKAKDNPTSKRTYSTTAKDNPTSKRTYSTTGTDMSNVISTETTTTGTISQPGPGGWPPAVWAGTFDFETPMTTTKATSKPPKLDLAALLDIIANLTYDYETNLTHFVNQTLQKWSIPTCAVPTNATTVTTPTTIAEYDYWVNGTGAVMGKCFVCGLQEQGIPYHGYCGDAFGTDFIPLTPVNAMSRGQIGRYRKYCRYMDIVGSYLNESDPKSLWGRWTGGCGVRWIDLTTIYTQRTCRNRLRASLGRHYLSKRMAKLEMALQHVEDGCVISPVASLVPMSRGINLYGRFHACVCTAAWCNAGGKVDLDVFVVFWCIVSSKVILK